jgi:peptide/nickel transport system substrate-binding protein
VEDAVWTDGTPITSADAKFSIEEAIRPLHPSGETNFGPVTSIDTPDDKTVVLSFDDPFSPFMAYLGHQNAPILPKHVYEGTDIMENPNNFEPTVSGGPFVFEEWTPGDHITLAGNDTYFEEGRPYLERIVFKFIPDPQGRVLALEAGEVDYIPPINMPETEMNRVDETDGLVLATTGFESSQPFFFWGFNTRREPLDNVLVRRALSHAVDKDFIRDAVFFGFGDDIVGPISPRSWAYDPDATGYEYDPEKAKQMLDEAGYPVGDDGTRFSMTITHPGDINSYVKTSEVLAANLEAIEIDVELVPMERSAYYPTVYEEWDFDFAGLTWGSGPDPDNISTVFHSSQIRPLIFTNFMGYSNPEVDALFDQAKTETNIEVRTDLYQEIQRMIIEDAPAVFVIGPHRNSSYREGIHGIPPGPFYGTRDPADNVWIEQP